MTQLLPNMAFYILIRQSIPQPLKSCDYALISDVCGPYKVQHRVTVEGLVCGGSTSHTHTTHTYTTFAYPLALAAKLIDF